MTKLKMLYPLILVIGLMGCEPSKTGLEGREVPPPTNGPGNNEKPDPDNIDKIEDFRPLFTQAPTSDVDKFANVLTLDLTKNEQAWFTFTYAPKSDGVLYFNTKYVKPIMDCSIPGPSKFSRRIYWQEYTKSTRTFLSEVTQTSAVLEYKAGKLYALTYAMTKLKQEFPNCDSGTLRFAVFE